MKTVVDATVGEGGHAKAILARMGEDGSVIGFDRDPGMAAIAAANLAPFGPRAVVRNAHYADMGSHLDDLGIGKVDGVLFVAVGDDAARKDVTTPSSPVTILE